MMEKLRLNRFLRGCLEAKLDFSKIILFREVHHENWAEYFPRGVRRRIVHREGTRFYIGKDGWNCKEGMGDCEILTLYRTRKEIIVKIGEGWF